MPSCVRRVCACFQEMEDGGLRFLFGDLTTTVGRGGDDAVRKPNGSLGLDYVFGQENMGRPTIS